jgi:hypothetical protein
MFYFSTDDAQKVMLLVGEEQIQPVVGVASFYVLYAPLLLEWVPSLLV